MGRISVGCTSGLAAAYLSGDPSEAALDELKKNLRGSGGDLAPQSPALRPDDLDPSSDELVWFTADVDDQVGDDLARRLLDVEGVHAAFVVPPEGPP